MGIETLTTPTVITSFANAVVPAALAVIGHAALNFWKSWKSGSLKKLSEGYQAKALAELEVAAKQAEAIAIAAATAAAHKAVEDFHNNKTQTLLQDMKQVAQAAAIESVQGIFKAAPKTSTKEQATADAPVMLFTQPAAITPEVQPDTSADQGV